MIDLDHLRLEAAQYMIRHAPKASIDDAIAYIVGIAYQQGRADERAAKNLELLHSDTGEYDSAISDHLRDKLLDATLTHSARDRTGASQSSQASCCTGSRDSADGAGA